MRWSGSADGLALGTEAEVVGTIAAPYGQTEIREVERLTIGAGGPPPVPVWTELAAIGESTEAGLVAVQGTVQSVTSDSGRITVVVGDGSVAVKVMASPLTGLTHDDVAKGDSAVVSGVVGQHASATGKEDGYKVWLRAGDDLQVVSDTSTPEPESSSASSDPLPKATNPGLLHDLSSLSGKRGSAIDVEAAVTATAGLLDIGGPTIVVDDGFGSVGVVLPAGVAAPGVGMRVHITGKVGSWQTGPTILATRVDSEGELQAVAPELVDRALTSVDEWRLIRVCGSIGAVTHVGTRWRVDLQVNGQQVVVLGEPAASISITSTSVGRLAMVTGVVRRSTSDSAAFQLLPRSALDVRSGPTAVSSAGSPAPAEGVAGVSIQVDASGGPLSGRVAISALPGLMGSTVTVVGLVIATADGEVTIDDGTGQMRVGGSDASAALALLEPGDALEVKGSVAQDDRGFLIQADAASILILPGGEAVPTATPGHDDGTAAGTPVSARPSQIVARQSIRQMSSATPLPEAIPVLGVVALVVVVVAGSIAAHRRKHVWSRLGRVAIAISPRRSAGPK